MLRKLDRIHCECNTNIALESASALTIIELFDRVRTHCETVIVEPIDERPGRPKLFSDDRIVICTHKHAARTELGEKPLESMLKSKPFAVW